MNDPISSMTDREIQDACESILGSGPWAHHSLIGLMIEKLQEWGCYFKWVGCWRIAARDGCDYETYPSLQILFLRTAHELGHWTPPQKKVELTLEERIARLEAFIAKRSEQFPNTKNL